MLRKRVNLVIALVVLVLKIVVVFGEGYAADLDVTLVVNPKSTEIYAGSANIVITVDATGKDLTFTWKLKGPGKLEDEGAAAFYIPPTKIGQESASAIVTITVKEPSGQSTIKSVTFTILPSPTRTPTPSPVAPPAEKKTLSKGKITALGLGAAAALGGGIALAVGGGDGGDDDGGGATGYPETCAGTWVGNYCWYLGDKGGSCTPVCASHGGYHEATRTYAGSDGTSDQCWEVLAALGAPIAEPNNRRTLDNIGGNPRYNGTGCSYQRAYEDIVGSDRLVVFWWHNVFPSTHSDASLLGNIRACACAE